MVVMWRGCAQDWHSAMHSTQSRAPEPALALLTTSSPATRLDWPKSLVRKLSVRLRACMQETVL